MAKHQIKHRWSDSVLFECDVPDDMASGLRTRYVLEKAVEADAYLVGAYLAGAYLADAYLAGANLAGTNLAGANLAGANLAGAYLAGASLADAYLAGANLAGTNLAGANLAGAYLAGANLAGASLADASLADACLAGANLAGAKWREGVVINKAPIQLFGLHWRVTILDEHMQIGCDLHKLSDWAQYDDKRIAEMDGREALRFWRAHKDALLGLAKGAGRGVAAEPVAATE
jgi:hypothetical protein